MEGTSRVWIYPAERKLTPEEISDISSKSKDFVEKWTAHNVALHASCEVLFKRFLILTVDENAHGASGCSIDSSVRFIHQLEEETGIGFMNGGKVALEIEDDISLYTTAEVKKLSSQHLVNENTYMFDHLVKNVAELRERFRIKAGQSWLNRFIMKKEEV